MFSSAFGTSEKNYFSSTLSNSIIITLRNTAKLKYDKKINTEP